MFASRSGKQDQHRKHTRVCGVVMLTAMSETAEWASAAFSRLAARSAITSQMRATLSIISMADLDGQGQRQGLRQEPVADAALGHRGNRRSSQRRDVMSAKGPNSSRSTRTDRRRPMKLK